MRNTRTAVPAKSGPNSAFCAIRTWLLPGFVRVGGSSPAPALKSTDVVAVHVLAQGDHFAILDFDEEGVAIVVALAVFQLPQALCFDGGVGPLHHQVLDQDLRVCWLEESLANRLQKIVDDLFAAVLVACALDSGGHDAPDRVFMQQHAQFFELTRAQRIEKMAHDLFVFRFELTHFTLPGTARIIPPGRKISARSAI